jgi:hypothetical protein
MTHGLAFAKPELPIHVRSASFIAFLASEKSSLLLDLTLKKT